MTVAAAAATLLGSLLRVQPCTPRVWFKRPASLAGPEAQFPWLLPLEAGGRGERSAQWPRILRRACGVDGFLTSADPQELAPASSSLGAWGLDPPAPVLGT